MAVSVALLLPLVATGAEPFPPDSPEHQALTTASESLGDPDFTLREEYWKGAITLSTGRAVRLQFFKRNHYRLFLGAAPPALPKGARLHLHLFDAENTEIATASGEPGEAAVALDFENTVGTGLYLVLMRIEAPPSPLIGEDVPAVLFYGWK